MLIAGVIALCIVLAILAFLAPRLSRHPQHGASKAFGLGARQRHPCRRPFQAAGTG